MNLKVLKISATITKLHPSHTQDIKKKKKVKLCSNKVLLAKTSGGLICLTYLHWTLHFKLSKNLLTTVSIIGPIIIFIFHFIFWNNFHNFIYKNRKENVDKEKVTFSYFFFFSNDPHKSSLWFLPTLYQSLFVFVLCCA